MSASPYHRWVRHNSVLVRKMTYVSTTDSCVQSLEHSATPGLLPFDNTIQKLISLSFMPQHMFLEDTHVKFPSVCCLHSLAPYCINLPIPQNLHDDVMHPLHNDAKMFTDMLKCYVTITLHHLILSAIWIRVSGMGWTAGACQILSAAPTLFEPLVPVKHCCMLPTAVNIHMLHSQMIVHFSCPSTHRKWMTQHCACPDKSMTVIHWATNCCAEITQSSMLMLCAYCGQKWPLLDGTRLINIKLHII